MATAASKPAAEKEPESTAVAPISPTGLQVGERTSAPITTNPPRGVNEPASNAIAGEEVAAELQKHVQSVIDKESAQGYRGDPNKNRTPNENYTLRGVGKGLPTPETTVYTPSSK